MFAYFFLISDSCLSIPSQDRLSSKVDANKHVL